MNQIPLRVDVECTDGLAGKTTSVIVNRETLQPTHFAVREDLSPHTERLVPVSYVAELTADLVRLNCTMEEFRAMDEFITITYETVELMRYAGAADGSGTIYTPEIETYTEKTENLPKGGISIRSGKEVQARDGKVGRAVNLIEDPATGEVTHFVMREAHLWGDKDLIVPVSMISYIDDEAIHLKTDKQMISAMLAVPVRKSMDLTQYNLASVTFSEPGKAGEFLKSLQKQATVRFSNAAVLVKNSDGKTSLQETQDVDKRHGTLFGAITGGLVGLLGGPAGAIIGAAAGAATGRSAAKRIDLGFPDEFLKKLQAGLQPGSSALVVLLDQAQSASLAEAAASSGGQFLQLELTQDILANTSGASNDSNT